MLGLAACHYFFFAVRWPACKTEHRAVTHFVFSLTFYDAASRDFWQQDTIQAGLLFLVSTTSLDDLDNAGAEEDDSCHKTVKFAFLPLHFPLSRVSGEETVSFDPLCLL